MRNLAIGLLLVAGAGTAAAQPATTAPRKQPAPPAQKPAPAPALPSSLLLPTALLLAPPTPPQIPSLRIEAARVASEAFEDSWRYPEPAPLFAIDHGLLFFGSERYHPRSARSAALHGGAIASTLLGEILIDSGSPLAGVGALLTGATLDAANADADRNAEARH